MSNMIRITAQSPYSICPGFNAFIVRGGIPSRVPGVPRTTRQEALRAAFFALATDPRQLPPPDATWESMVARAKALGFGVESDERDVPAHLAPLYRKDREPGPSSPVIPTGPGASARIRAFSKEGTFVDRCAVSRYWDAKDEAEFQEGLNGTTPKASPPAAARPRSAGSASPAKPVAHPTKVQPSATTPGTNLTRLKITQLTALTKSGAIPIADAEAEYRRRGGRWRTPQSDRVSLENWKKINQLGEFAVASARSC